MEANRPNRSRQERCLRRTGWAQVRSFGPGPSADLVSVEAHLHASYIGTAAKAMGMTRADVLGSIVASARKRLG